MSCTDRKALNKTSTLAKLVAEFLDLDRCCPNDEIKMFSDLPIKSAIKKAARARDGKGKLFKHQWNLFNHPEVSQEAESRLLKSVAEILACKNFDVLHELIKTKLQIKWAKEMYWYDTAFRIGIAMGVYPKKIYLHAGTRRGAKALGVYEKGKEVLEMKELIRKYPEFMKMKPHQVEDFLCIKEKQGMLGKFKR